MLDRVKHIIGSNGDNPNAIGIFLLLFFFIILLAVIAVTMMRNRKMDEHDANLPLEGDDFIE
jgi:hypothetical protein